MIEIHFIPQENNLSKLNSKTMGTNEKNESKFNLVKSWRAITKLTNGHSLYIQFPFSERSDYSVKY